MKTFKEFVRIKVPVTGKSGVVQDVYLAVSFKELVELGTAEKIAEYLKEIAIKNKKAAQQKGDAVSRRLYVSLENKIEASQNSARTNSQNLLTVVLQREGYKKGVIASQPVEYNTKIESYYPKLTKKLTEAYCYKTEKGKVLYMDIETRLMTG